MILMKEDIRACFQSQAKRISRAGCVAYCSELWHDGAVRGFALHIVSVPPAGEKPVSLYMAEVFDSHSPTDRQQAVDALRAWCDSYLSPSGSRAAQA